MKKQIHFETTIDAPRRKVWDVMLGPESFRAWTSEFMEGSHYQGSWEKGAAVRFLADNNGMSAVIAENRPYEFVSIKHVGFIQNGVEDTDSEAVRSWAPAYENYRLSDSGAGTRVEVEMDVTPDYEDDMLESWPRALARLKEICENPQR